MNNVLPKAIQPRVDAMVRRVALDHSKRIRDHIEGRVLEALASNLQGFEIERAILRLESMPAPTFMGWPSTTDGPVRMPATIAQSIVVGAKNLKRVVKLEVRRKP
jgi:hypothetical protein